MPRLPHAPGGPPRGLERLATACLKAEAQDSRLGDLSEQYVRTRVRAGMVLDCAPLATTLSHLAADARYVLSAANVVLCARAVDPVVRLAEPGAMESIALDLKERTMTALHTAARRIVLPALLLVGTAYLINSAYNVWSTWRETEALIVGLQREKAEAVAMQIDRYFAAVHDHLAWAVNNRTQGASPEQRRFDYLRLLRQVPAIVEIAELDGNGRETLRLSRLRSDTANSGADFSNDARFTEAARNRTYVGPVTIDKRSEPNVSLALAHAGPNSGVTLAEINIKRVWDIVDTVRVGETGYAYVVDGRGRLIASRDRERALRQRDLSDLPQVQAAAPSATSGEGATFATSPSGAAVVSVHAPLPALGWKVFVDVPLAEARAPLWSALFRAVCMLGLGLLAISLASLAAVRRDVHVQPARI